MVLRNGSLLFFKLRYVFCVIVFLNANWVQAQNYFRKYIDSEEHFDEFNGQLFVIGDSITLLNYVSSPTIPHPFASIVQMDLFGNIKESVILDSFGISYNAGNVKNSNLFIVGSNNYVNPNSKFVFTNTNFTTGISNTNYVNLFDSGNDLTLIPVGSVAYDSSQIIYGQYKKTAENSTMGFLTWVNRSFGIDTVLIFEDDMDWAIVSDATIDKQNKLVVFLEVVKLVENVEHHQRIIRKYNSDKEKLFEWRSKIFYSDHGVGSMSVLQSGTVVIECPNKDYEFVSSIIAIDTFGSELWTWGFPLFQPAFIYQISDMITTESNDIICSGSYRNVNQGILTTGYLLKINSEGEFIWERIFIDKSEYSVPEYKLSKYIFFQNIDEIHDKSLAIGGKIINSFGEANENTDIFFAIVDSTGCINENCNLVQDISPIDEFLDSTNIWTECYYIDNFEQATSLKFTLSASSTVLSGKEYYEVLRSNSENSNFWSTTGVFIRTSNDIVYSYKFQKEYELYDFNLNLNDTFNVFIQDGITEQLIVVDLDTVILLNGEQKKLWKFRKSEDLNPPIDYEYTYWIEGIGNTRDLLANERLWSEDLKLSILLCLYKDSSLVYDNPNVDGCWIITTSIKDVMDERVFLVPNPVHDELTIKLAPEFPADAIVRIYDLIGRPLQTLTLSIDQQKINMRNYPEGIYLLNISKDGHILASRKILKL